MESHSLCIGYNICLHQCKSKVFVSTKHCSVLTLLILSILAAAQHFNLVYLQPCLLSLPQCHRLQNAQHGFIDILQRKKKIKTPHSVNQRSKFSSEQKQFIKHKLS